jgi:hypothetical protein
MRSRQTESAKKAEMQNQNNRDSTMRSRQTESAKKVEMRKQTTETQQ